MAEFPYVNEFHLYREFPEFYDIPFWYDLEVGYLITRAIARGYIVEIHLANGDLVDMLQYAFGIGLQEELNRPPMLDFRLPADDNKADGITEGREAWLRDYDTGEVLHKFVLTKRKDIRE